MENNLTVAGEIVEAKLHAVVDSSELQASREASGGFPLELGVTDVAECLARDAVEHLACHEVGA